MWRGLLAIGGALAVLAGVVYFVGQVSLWIKLQHKGYAPDAAIEHQPRNHMIIVGLPGALAVAVVTVVLVPFGWTLARRLRRTAAGARTARLLAAEGLGLVVVCALFNWRLLAVAIVFGTLVIVVFLHVQAPHEALWHWLLVPVGVLIAAIVWVYGSPVYTTSVSVRPKRLLPIDAPIFAYIKCVGTDGERVSSRYAVIHGRRVWMESANRCRMGPTQSGRQIVDYVRNCTVPYFGETDEFVYLGSIRNVKRSGPNDDCQWGVGPIVEIRRDSVRLRFVAGQASLGWSRELPIAAGWDAVRSFFEKF